MARPFRAGALTAIVVVHGSEQLSEDIATFVQRELEANTDALDAIRDELRSRIAVALMLSPEELNSVDVQIGTSS